MYKFIIREKDGVLNVTDTLNDRTFGFKLNGKKLKSVDGENIYTKTE